MKPQVKEDGIHIKMPDKKAMVKCDVTWNAGNIFYCNFLTRFRPVESTAKAFLEKQLALDCPRAKGNQGQL
jgi:hypothetical protein